MNILKEFRGFFCNNGIHEMINSFRNPSWEEQFFFDRRYDPNLDAQLWFDESAVDTAFDPNKVTHFHSSLNGRLKGIKHSIVAHIDNLIQLKADRELLKQAFSDSELDFVKIRKEIGSDKSLIKYKDQLVEFIIDIEALMSKSKRSLLSNLEVNPKKSKSYFGFNNKEQLRKFYHDLIADDYINDIDTSEDDFISVLASKDINKVKGVIRFNCETRQAAYIIYRLIQLSEDNIKIKDIGESKKFISKRGAFISSINISKSKSETSQTAIKNKKEIDSIFFSFLKNQ